jgi:hypothetical protein
MKTTIACLSISATLSLFSAVAQTTAGPQGGAAALPAGTTNLTGSLRGQFLQLCDLAAVKVRDERNRVPFFVDSYAVRALCVAYDMTGRTNYLDACRDWSDRMVADQDKMTPRGAYYMHYNRKPGETNGDWYAADSASIGMAVLATSVRCQGAERKRLRESTEQFAGLLLGNYVKPGGGVSDGLWHVSNQEWWCSSGIGGSFLFNLYANTGNKKYLQTALGITDWLNRWDLTKDQPFPLSQQGPAMIFYVLENYSAGWPYIQEDAGRRKAAEGKVAWCLDWIAQQQQLGLADRPWPPSKGWGLKFGGLPFHQYTFSRYRPDAPLAVAGDAELQRLARLVFVSERPTLKQLMPTIQLPMFMLMSYAERLDPGAVYRAAR